MKCPDCSAEMTSQGVFLHCKACRLVWLARDDFDAAVADIERVFRPEGLTALQAECRDRQQALAAKAFDPDAQVRYTDCPECGAQMLRRAFAPDSGILLNLCAPHGVLMADESLRQALDYIRRGGEMLNLYRRLEELQGDVQQAKGRERDAEQRAAISSTPIVLPFMM